MNFLTYTTIVEANRTGVDGLLLYVSETVPIFIPLTLFVFFFIIVLSTSFSQKRLTGSADYPASFAVAGWMTTVLAYVFFLLTGLVNIFTVSVCLVVSIISTVILFFSER